MGLGCVNSISLLNSQAVVIICQDKYLPTSFTFYFFGGEKIIEENF